jgi:ankyrin repeat protein
MLEEIAEYLGNDLATYAIKRVLEYCQSENCKRCSADHQKLMERALCSAAKRANFKLVELLLPHTTMKDGGLAAAVRSGSRELIDIFFLHGANVGGPACYIDRSKLGQDPSPPTTPLAEAIRSQDKDLVHEFENLGALTCINQESHFKAAMVAAAEIGDCHYMKMLLQHVPEKRGQHLMPALNVAIRQDDTEAALVLLDNGANVNQEQFFTCSPSLMEALRKQNRAVVDTILEADVNLDIPIMDLAVFWGDISVIEDLILMGANVNNARDGTTALTVAVKLRKKDLVKLLLKAGAWPSAGARSGGTPLTAAIKNEDDEMIHFLLSCGADPADTDAFLSALEKNPEIFDTLLRAFSSKYPDGKPAFGGTLLITAVKRGDAALLNRMLVAKFDVNSLSRRYFKRDFRRNFGGEYYYVTALGFAIMRGKRADESLHLVRELINHGDPNSIVLRHSPTDKVAMPLKTALLVAIETRSEHMVKLLLEKGADVHRPARQGLKRTPLQQACEIGSFKMVKLLLEHNANANEEPAQRSGATALQLAAISGSIKTAELLLRHGAWVHAAPAKVRGQTAFEGAAEHSCVEMIRVLWDAAEAAETSFTPEQIEKAKNLALSQGHRGCAEYIDSLSSATSLPLLQ